MYNGVYKLMNMLWHILFKVSGIWEHLGMEETSEKSEYISYKLYTAVRGTVKFFEVKYTTCTKILLSVYSAYIDPYTIPSLKSMDRHIIPCEAVWVVVLTYSWISENHIFLFCWKSPLFVLFRQHYLVAPTVNKSS